MKSSQIEHNLQIYHRYQQIPFVKGAPFSKPPFWVSMLVFGSVSFPLGNGRTSPKLKQKKIHPSHQGHSHRAHQLWQSQDLQRAPAPPFCLEVPPFSPLGLASASVRFSTSNFVPAPDGIHGGGKHATDEPGNLEIRWGAKTCLRLGSVYPSMRPNFFYKIKFLITSQVVFSPEFLNNHQQ